MPKKGNKPQANFVMLGAPQPPKPAPKKAAPQGPGRVAVQTTNAPVAIGRRIQVSRPNFRALNSNGDIIVSHSELISDILGNTSAFSLPDGNVKSINPGLSACFPWLSKIARNYESYQFEKLEFSFETSSSTAATGLVAISVDYDPGDPKPTSKNDLYQARGTVRGPAWESLRHRSLKSDLVRNGRNGTLFIRQGTPDTPLGGGSFDLRNFDAGNVFVAVGGQASSTVAVGELWVHYIVKLLTPQGSVNPADCKRIIATTGGASAAGPLFGSAPTTSGPLPISISATGSTVTFLTDFQGIIDYICLGTTLTAAWADTGTATFTLLKQVVNGAADSVHTSVLVDADAGETSIPVIGTQVAFTSINARYAPYDVALA